MRSNIIVVGISELIYFNYHDNVDKFNALLNKYNIKDKNYNPTKALIPNWNNTYYQYGELVEVNAKMMANFNNDITLFWADIIRSTNILHYLEMFTKRGFTVYMITHHGISENLSLFPDFSEINFLDTTTLGVPIDSVKVIERVSFLEKTNLKNIVILQNNNTFRSSHSFVLKLNDIFDDNFNMEFYLKLFKGNHGK